MNSKEKILNIATRMFAEKGFDGVSIRDICKEAQVNVCMISYYWGGKKELYQGILEDLIEKQNVYAKTFVDLDRSPASLERQEQIDLMMLILDKIVDFFYSGNISSELIVLLLKEQQKKDFAIDPPVVKYLRELMACLLNKDINDREAILKTLLVLAQINSPRILPGFSLRLLGQDEFFQEDIKIIKENVKSYVKMLIKESEVD